MPKSIYSAVIGNPIVNQVMVHFIVSITHWKGHAPWMQPRQLRRACDWNPCERPCDALEQILCHDCKAYVDSLRRQGKEPFQ